MSSQVQCFDTTDHEHATPRDFADGWHVKRPGITLIIGGSLDRQPKGEHHEAPFHTYVRNNPGSSDCSGIYGNSANRV